MFLPTAAATRLNAGVAGISLRRNGATLSLVVAALICYGELPFMHGRGLRLAPRAVSPWHALSLNPLYVLLLRNIKNDVEAVGFVGKGVRGG